MNGVLLCCHACRALQCPRCSVRAEGTLAPEIAKSASLATINVQYNRLAGPLPAAYGEPGAASSLLHLIVSYNQLSGGMDVVVCG